jgi:hypothetical protein
MALSARNLSPVETVRIESVCALKPLQMVRVFSRIDWIQLLKNLTDWKL